jgi:hypothetical protein
MTRLTVEASHLLRPCLERRGWHLVKTQTLRPNGVALDNHVMEIRL